MSKAKELITTDNVVKTYNEGKYICFLLNNGFVVKLNPNESRDGEEGRVK